MITHRKILNIKILGILILLVGLFYTTLISSGVSGTSAAFSDSSIQKKEKILKHRRFPVEPIRIMRVSNKRQAFGLGRKFFEEDDWLKGLTISFKNTSNKTLTFVGFELHFIKPGAAEDEPIYAHQLVYNTKDTLQREIPSKKVAEITLTDEDYDTIKQSLTPSDYPLGASEVEIIVDEIRYSDGTFWRSGQYHESGLKKRS